MQLQQDRSSRFTWSGLNWPMRATVTDHPDIPCPCTMHPGAVEAMGHLRNARACLERLAIDDVSLTRGPDFPHFEAATRSIQGALLALDACEV